MECRSRLNYNVRTVYNKISSTHGFSPKHMGDDVIAGMLGLRHTFHNEVPLPCLKGLESGDPVCR